MGRPIFSLMNSRAHVRGRPALIRRLGIVCASLVVAVMAGCAKPSDRSNLPQVIGISTSLPIVWPEAAELSDLLHDDAPPHWALGVLQKRGDVKPLDSLAVPGASGGQAALPLPPDALLVLAQPFPFSPQEHVALDTWVRSGGKVLVFADPMLTAHSDYALGDRRRPQSIIKLAPILARWGLMLAFDAKQSPGVRHVQVAGGAMPVNLPGKLSLGPGPRHCQPEADGLLAYCTVEKGRALIVADAAMLESEGGETADSRYEMLDRLLDRLEA